MNASTNLASNKNFKLVKILATNAALAFTLLGSAGVAHAAVPLTSIPCNAPENITLNEEGANTCYTEIEKPSDATKFHVNLACYGKNTQGKWRISSGSSEGAGEFFTYINRSKILRPNWQVYKQFKKSYPITKGQTYTLGIYLKCYDLTHRPVIKLSTS
jgi:hypothetical protein